MINTEQIGNTLVVSHFNKAGGVDIKHINIPDSELFDWVSCDGKNCDPIVMTWDGKNVKKQQTKYLSNYRKTEFLLTLDKDLYDEIFENNVPKKYYCDIETEILDRFCTYENPQAKVLTIAITDQKSNIVVFGLKDLDDLDVDNINNKLNVYFDAFGNRIKFKYKKFNTEYDMLHSFFNFAMKKINFITGWNFVDFDWRYLMSRAKKIGLSTDNVSPTRKFDKKDLPYHKVVVDYMMVYKKWDRIVQMKDSHGLDFVANAALGVKKVKYSGTLNDLYSDFKEYVFYNAVDSYLVKLIDDKLNTLIPYFTLANITGVEQNNVFSPVNMVENIMVIQLWRESKRVFLKKIKSENDSKEKYSGAYVVEPKVGFHSDLSTFDYEGLYPTIIRQYNISPDVFLGKDPLYRGSDKIITSSGALFERQSNGVLKTLLEDVYSRRKYQKQLAGGISEEIAYLKEVLKNKKQQLHI